MIHHKYEDHAIMLSNQKYAIRNPYEWQLPENLVYCNYLEHLFLHVLICEHPAEDRNKNEAVGIGGVINFIVPELNDVYSGWVSKQTWQARYHERIIHDKDIYLSLLKRFKTNCSNHPLYSEKSLLRSFNEPYGIWFSEQDTSIYQEEVISL